MAKLETCRDWPFIHLPFVVEPDRITNKRKKSDLYYLWKRRNVYGHCN